jgi:hypothetical protein
MYSKRCRHVSTPTRMRRRRGTVQHPFGTIKARMGATHFLMKTLPRVASEMALHVLAYNLMRVLNIIGRQRIDGGDQGIRRRHVGSRGRDAHRRSLRRVHRLH